MRYQTTRRHILKKEYPSELPAVSGTILYILKMHFQYPSKSMFYGTA